MTRRTSRPARGGLSNTIHPDQRGFTLVELMITVLVAAILMAFAIPSFKRVMAGAQVTSQANELVETLRLARSEAARLGTPVAVLSTKASGDFAGGWTVFPNKELNGTKADGIETLRASGARPKTVSIKRTNSSYADLADSVTDAKYLIFNARGGASASYFRVCSSATPDVGRVVQVSTVGRVSVITQGVTCN